MEYNIPLLIGVALIIFTTYMLYLKWLRTKYPPGPLPLPIVGNLHLLTRLPHFDFANLAKYYGPVYTFWMGSEPAVVVCNFEGIREAAVDKGKEFAGRAMTSPPLQVLFNGNEDVLGRTYDEKHKFMRKLLQSFMNPKSNGGSSIGLIVEEEMQCLIEYIKNGNGRLEDPHTLINFPVSNIIVRALFHFRFQNADDPSFLRWIEMNKKFFSALESATMIALFNAFPFLWYIVPKLRKTVIGAATFYNRFVDSHLTKHEETYKKGIVRDLTDAVIASQDNPSCNSSSSQHLTRLNMLGLIKDLLTGGTDPITATVRWALLVLLHRSDIKKKLQQELDEYLIRRQESQKNTACRLGKADERGSNSLLFTVTDRPHLHYLNAFIYETFRRCSIAPMAAPHKTLVDSSIGDLKIPKGTTVILNTYASHVDEKVWERPFEFIPERFLDDEGRFDTCKAKNVMTFGGGPRRCAGEHLSRMEIFNCLANILHTFELSCNTEADLPSIDDGIYSIEYYPVPFKMHFNLRAAAM